MKIIAMYLPQFHRIPENDEWWGDGFTDWDTVKSASILYEGHYQPRIPLDGYYDLLEKTAMERQAILMKRYGVDGLCFYHYWFENGRRILEKPSENLLEWKDIDMPFCFSWANETWARSWTNIKNKNVWANTFEKQGSRENGILLKQSYGREDDWIEHFNYLLTFFKDKRYILKDGKPVFLIHRTSDIYCLNDMMRCWDNLAKRNGFLGLYVIGANCRPGSSGSIDARLQTEPATGIFSIFDKKGKAANGIQKIDYDEVWKAILNSRPEKDTFIEGFVDYDDTPRRGNDGIVVEHTTPGKFGEYLSRLIAKNIVNNKEITLINAWNEWGEGMYLEPDEHNRYGYLEAIQYARANYEKYLDEYKVSRLDDSSDYVPVQLKERIELNLEAIDEWLSLWEDGRSLSNYLITEKKTSEVIIHGYGVIGRHLYRELINGGVSIKYIVDQNKRNIHIDTPVYLQEEILSDPVDTTIIVTAMYFYDEIAKIYERHGFGNVVSIISLLDGCKDSEIK